MKLNPYLTSAALFCGLTLSVNTIASAQAAPVAPEQPKPSAAQESQAPQQVSTAATIQQGTAVVEFHDNLLRIAAFGADLNNVLQQVARVTGMHVQGTANGDRVYGDYGPAAAGEVLSRLLDGVSCNFVLTQQPGTPAPQQLVLSARAAGAATPSSTGAFVNRGTQPPRPVPPQAVAEPSEQQSDVGYEQEPQEETTPPELAPPPAPDDEQQVSHGPNGPNTPKTPQQFLEELKQMHETNRPQQPPQ